MVNISMTLKEPKHPWRLDTNNRYGEVVKTLIGLSTASLLLPVFFTRNFLLVGAETPLKDVFSYSLYFAWILLALSILSGVFFQYLSAKWVRLAWGQPAGLFFSENTKEETIERWMEFSFWSCVIAFLSGIFITIYFFTVKII